VPGSPPLDAPPPSARALADRMVARWCEVDRARAFVKSDTDVIDSTTAVRTVIAEHLQRDPVGLDRDLLNGFAVLGRLLGERGGSPTLASAVVDGALEALVSCGPAPEPQPKGATKTWLLPARAALAEAFALATLEAARAAANARWEYPGCAVAVGGGGDATVAIAAGYPDDDAEALAAWAARVAHAAAMAGVRRVVVSGSRAAEVALGEALELAGIASVPGQAAPTRPMPWRR
jgi:hypothetical protein